MISRIEECVLSGALYAYACPRGTGKSTIGKISAWWAVSYAHRRYPFLIGATGDKGESLLDSIKLRMRFNKDYSDDFPEISIAVRELKGKGNAASGQLCQGESTMIAWSKDEIVLPTVPPPPNFKDEWFPCYSKKKSWVRPALAPTSGLILKVSGLTGEGIRGSVKTTTEGEEIRPDFVLADDPAD